MIYFRKLSVGYLVMLSFALAIGANASAQTMRTINFQSTNLDFVNPERGFFHFRTLTSPSNFSAVRADDHSLIYGRIPAQSFRNAPFSQSFLDSIQAGFDEARVQGIKVKPRILYNDGPNDNGGGDAPKSVILGHIQQLQPLFEANKDVIYLMDAGFIGLWAEWHGSTNGLDNNADRTEIMEALLDALPSDRMVGIRTPHFKREIYNGSPIDDTLKITSANAFDESDISRVGHLNDCFLASSSDFGTYLHAASGWTRSAELAYIGGESRYAPHGGETCAVSAYSTGTNAIAEMEQLHTDYLNIDYQPDVIDDWVSDGTFDEISRRLGYRYELQTAQLPQAVRPSGVAEILLDIDNVGFGELFNPRELKVTLRNNATGDLELAALSLDPRLWSGGSSNAIQTFLSIPEDLAEGTYSVGLSLADADPVLSADPRFSIQFANTGVWESSTGINVLATDLEVSHGADGPVYAGLSAFAEVLDPTQLQTTVDADFDRDGDVDASDINALVGEIAQGGAKLLFDLSGDGNVDGTDLQQWLSAGGNENLGAGLSYLNGDANLDGIVDVTDLGIWSQSNSTSTAAWTSGDFNADGVVNDSDFQVWNSNRFTSSTNLAATVPEPQMMLAAVFSLLMIVMARRRF